MSSPSIEFRVFGSIELASATVSTEDLLRRPKRLALLTYLLVARPRGVNRREKLLTVFWPELSEAAGRHALRQALHELRRDLGPIIATRGPSEVSLSKDSIWCDAVAFDEALRKGDLAEAVTLYRGELLDSLSFRSVSAEFEDWLERERTRYRETTARAACGLAERAAAEGNTTSAARWARRAASLVPLDEAILCRLLVVFQQMGYRAGAEALFRQFETRLRSEFDLQPSEATDSLIRAIRGATELAELQENGV